MTSIPPRVLRPSPGQTIGPFFADGTRYPRMHEIASPHSPGAVVLGGTVLDGAGRPVPDAVIEIFGADHDGTVPRVRGSLRRDDHTFTGFGRAFTDDLGRWEFWTRIPGAADGRAAFFAAVVFARGLPDKLHTRIYAPAAQAVLDADPLLARLAPERRATLVATRTPAGHLHHDVHLQGEDETVFLAF